MRLRRCPCVCMCIPPIVARQRLGKSPLIVASQRLGKNLPSIHRCVTFDAIYWQKLYTN
jgi:hypothetical protein